MKYFALLTGFWLGTSPALAATPEEACDYFAGFLELDTGSAAVAVVDVLAGREDGTNGFGQVSLDLERYATFVSRPLLVATGSVNTPGSQTGHMSAIYTCFVDIVDERVLEVTVTDGPLVGQAIPVPGRTGDREVNGPVPASYAAGIAAHRGRY